MNWYDRTPAEVEKTLVLDTGTKVTFRKNPPHGHWTIHYEHGEMAPALKSIFTSYELARRAFESYVANKTQRKSEIVEDSPPVPVDEKKAPKKGK